MRGAVKTFSIAACLCAVISLTGSLGKQRAAFPASGDAPLVYSTDARDPWNRIFRCLFTRTVRARLSEEFAAGKPFGQGRTVFPRLRTSRRVFERAETGDRAIEPLYPSFIDTSGPQGILSGPLYSELRGALVEALGEARARPPLQRALMQADAWAAFDRLHGVSTSGYLGSRTPRAEWRRLSARKDELLGLLARFMRKIALTPAEIAALPDNYKLAARDGGVPPDVFQNESGWMEVEWEPNRLHDHAADFRRAARVFIKPAHATPDHQAFLNSLRNANDTAERVQGAALITQNLLIDTEGRVVSSPLTYEAQFRFFSGRGAALKTEVRQFELSRRLLVAGGVPGGFESLDANSEHYLPSAGNDYGFASPRHDEASQPEPVVVTLSTRCDACHAQRAAHFFTFVGHEPASASPPVRILKPSLQERAVRAARLKTERAEFRALLRYWQSN